MICLSCPFCPIERRKKHKPVVGFLACAVLLRGMGIGMGNWAKHRIVRLECALTDVKFVFSRLADLPPEELDLAALPSFLVLRIQRFITNVLLIFTTI